MYLQHFNSRPHGGRPCRQTYCASSTIFQLTPSRRATCCLSISYSWKNISTHALTEGDFCWLGFDYISTISTHALTEGDLRCLSTCSIIGHFNSRPHGGRPFVSCCWMLRPYISTHALTEGDLRAVSPVHQVFPFQLTPSRRATMFPRAVPNTSAFQLTPSRRATGSRNVSSCARGISTHALTEGDVLLGLYW